MLSKFEVDPSKIDCDMLVDKQKFHSYLSYNYGGSFMWRLQKIDFFLNF